MERITIRRATLTAAEIYRFKLQFSGVDGTKYENANYDFNNARDDVYVV